MEYNIKDIVKNRQVAFDHYRAGNLYYKICFPFEEVYRTCLFPVPISDTGEATFNQFDKAIYFMRYIRKAIEEGTFVKV